jgi:hypothetical protein
MRIADGFQATASIDSVKLHDQTLAAELRLQVCFPMPAQDVHLPHRIAAHVHAAGLEAQRCLFRALMEKADQEVVLENRAGSGHPAPRHPTLYLRDRIWHRDDRADSRLPSR